MVIGNYSWLLVIWTHSCSSSHKLTFPEPVENPKLILIVGSVGLLINLVRNNITNIYSFEQDFDSQHMSTDWSCGIWGRQSRAQSLRKKWGKQCAKSEKILRPCLNTWPGHGVGEEDEAAVGHQHPHKHGKEEMVVHCHDWDIINDNQQNPSTLVFS